MTLLVRVGYIGLLAWVGLHATCSPEEREFGMAEDADFDAGASGGTENDGSGSGATGGTTSSGGTGGDGAIGGGAIEVSTKTFREDRAPGVYTVRLAGESRAIAVTGATSFVDLAVGEHQVELEVTGPCAVVGVNPKVATVVADETIDVHFDVACTAGLIAYGGGEVYVMNADGSNAVNAPTMRTMTHTPPGHQTVRTLFSGAIATVTPRCTSWTPMARAF